MLARTYRATGALNALTMRSHCWSKFACGLLLLSTSAWAEYPYSQDYTEAAKAVMMRRYTDARSLAEDMLTRDPDSFEGDAVLGQAHLWGEEDLGLARHHLARARAMIERSYPDLKSENSPQRLHQQVLRALRQVEFLGENYEGALTLAGEYDALYDPLPVSRSWLLLKLRRFGQAEEVIAAAQAGLPDDDPDQVPLCDNLGQIAYEQGDLKRALTMFERACELELEFAEKPDPVYFTNSGEALRDMRRFDEAEERFQKAKQWPNPGSYAEPNKRLAYLYAGAGRFEEAFAHLEAAVLWRAELWPQVAAHTRASHLTGAGEVLLAFGDARRARGVLERALLFPYRQAMNSGSSEVLLAKRYLLYAGALHLEAEQYEEAAVTHRGWVKFNDRRRAWTARLTAAWARSQAAVILARTPGLVHALRPYGAGAMQSPWLLSELANALGQPVIEKILSDPEQPIWSDYAELMGETSLTSWEALVKAQMLARGGKWKQALKLDPIVSRRLGLSIGLKVRGSNEAAELLFASPRFHEGDSFTLKIDSQLGASLLDRSGESYLNLPPQSSPERLCEAIHQALFQRSTTWSATKLDGLTQEAVPGRLVSRKLAEWLDPESF